MNLARVARLLYHRAQAARHDRWDRHRLEAHQQHGLARLRTLAYERSPFYRKFHAGLMNRPLAALPILTKSAVMGEFDALVTDRAIHLRDVEAHLASTPTGEGYLGRYTVSATSGSTGQRGFFLFDRPEWAALVGSYARPGWWAGVKVSLREPMRVARFGSPVPWHQSVQVSSYMTSSLAPTLVLDSTRPLAEAVRKLNDWQPRFLGTYASLARALADEQLAGRLNIAPEMIGMGGEVLTAEARRRIEAAWGKVLFDFYGASESGVLATECDRHDGLHLFEDLSIVEIVDARGEPVPPGELGERVLVTVLFRRTQPLIRYEISDRVRLAAQTCPCGRPYRLIEAIQGRVEETLYFPSASGERIAIDPVVFDAVLDTAPARQWQVVQRGDLLEVLLAGLQPDFSDERIVLPLKRELAACGARVRDIRLVRVDAIPRGATGKAALIRSERTTA